LSNLIDKGYGITRFGFNRPNLAVILNDAEEDFKETDSFGPDFSFANDKAFKEFYSAFGRKISTMWELAEQLYNNNPATADGNSLFSLGSFISITRKQASKSKGIVTFTGAQGTQIPMGFQVSTVDGIVFITDTGGTIPQSGTINIDVTSVEAGINNNVNANLITRIISPLPGLVSVNNSAATAGGENQETEPEFRKRYFDTLEEGSGANVDGIAGTLRRVEGVTDAIVKENATNATVNGVPSNSIYAIVQGGSNNNIAQAIFNKKAGGIESYGTTSVAIKDSQGADHTIKFSRPTEVDIYAKLTLTKGTSYPNGADDIIKNAIADYINIQLGIGEDVIIYQLISVVANLNIQGLNNVIIELSKTSSGHAANNITIAETEISKTDTAKVVIA
jgi:uncharacterized phage protein gp47/JayE